MGTHADDVSPYGVFDLGGNVNEWTADLLRPYPGAPADVRVPAETRRVIRGGDYLAPVRDARCTRRDGAREDYTSEVVGFRVVIEPPAELVSVFR